MAMETKEQALSRRKLDLKKAQALVSDFEQPSVITRDKLMSLESRVASMENSLAGIE